MIPDLEEEAFCSRYLLSTTSQRCTPVLSSELYSLSVHPMWAAWLVSEAILGSGSLKATGLLGGWDCFPAQLLAWPKVSEY